MSEPRATFLICTVGGSPEPIIAALKHWRPVRVCFVHTSQIDVEADIVARANQEQLDLDVGRYECFELPDGQDMERCLDRLRDLTPIVTAWLARGPRCQVVVDYTGGTKCMSAAIVLHARQWPCQYSYVGGDDRTKGGVGVVVSGAEKIVHQANPWNALGAQAVEEYIMLFDQLGFAAAARIAGEAMKRMTREDRKSELSVLEKLADGFEAWERFEHTKATASFKTVDRRKNDLRAVLGPDTADRVLASLEQFAPTLDRICNTQPPSRDHVLDLLGNARRRRDEGRFDDAVARLYRAFEAHAQAVLRASHGIASTEKVPVDCIPPSLQPEWLPRAREGRLALGLQDAYTLLDALGDPAGRAFKDARLDGSHSPLTARNRSILAHGFDRVSDRVFDPLWNQVLGLVGCTNADLPVFPRLGEARGRPAHHS